MVRTDVAATGVGPRSRGQSRLKEDVILEPLESEVVELLAELVAVDSQNPGRGERQIAGLVASESRRRGFEVELVEAAPGRPNVIVDIAAGTGPRLGFNAHLDTKPTDASQWRTDPLQLTLADGCAYGLGTSDMKAAVAALLVAGSRWASKADQGHMQLVFSCDEELGSTFGAAYLARERKLDLDAILVAEPSGISRSWEGIHTVSRGMTCFQVDVHARQGHSGLSQSLGTSATVGAARLIDALSRFEPSFPESPGDVRPTVNAAARVEGGEFYGIHPGFARFWSEVRLVPGMRRDVFDQEVRAALAQAAPADIHFELSYLDGAFGWAEAASIAPQHQLVLSAQRAALIVLGATPPLTAYPAGTDATFFVNGAGIPSLASFGPGLISVAHAPDEYVPVEDLAPAAQIYELVMDDFAAH